jgi:hypothetical protein
MKQETKQAITGISFLILISSYVVLGWIGAYAALGIPGHLNEIAHSFQLKLWYAWLYFGTLLATIQLFVIPFSLYRASSIFQNPIIKGTAFIGQMCWAPYAYNFPPWYAWVISSGFIFCFTPLNEKSR